jgi:hypothetical protein
MPILSRAKFAQHAAYKPIPEYLYQQSKILHLASMPILCVTASMFVLVVRGYIGQAKASRVILLQLAGSITS